MSVRTSDPTISDQGALIRDVIRRLDTDARAGSTEAAAFDVGARLRRMRKERQLTLQAASRLSGVSTSAFSKIERNELSPTISTMQRIAQGLGVELAALVTEESGGNEAYRGRRGVSRAGDGTMHVTRTCNNVLLCADLKNKRVTPVLTRVTARSTDEYAAWAKSDSEIFLMVQQGTLVVHSRLYEPLELQQGDAMYYDASVEHAWTTKGDEDAIVLWVLTLT